MADGVLPLSGIFGSDFYTKHDQEKIIDIINDLEPGLMNLPLQDLYNDFNNQNFEIYNDNMVQESNQVNEQPMVIKTESLEMKQQDIVCNENYCGPFNFEVFINPHHGNKSPWVYSSSLEKIFITVNNKFPVDFKWDSVENHNMFVRATPIFGAPQFSQEFVTRCIAHAQSTDATNKSIPPHIWQHVIRCQNKNARYEGDVQEEKRLSVVVPLGSPESGSDTVRQLYQFVCKNSCPSGMNRRPLEVVFTLEDQYFNVLGRKLINVRICSCPKRDKDKEEKEHYNKDNAVQPNGKKRKLEKNKKPISFTESTDTKEYDVNLKIIGKSNVKALLKYAHDLMAGDMIRHGTDQPYKKCLLEISNKIKNPSE